MADWKRLGGAAAAAALVAGPGNAQVTSTDGQALLKTLTDCRAVASDAQRLACYDAAAARLEGAERAGDVVVVDRAQARVARRQAFGFNLPSLDIFNRGEAEAEVDQLTLTVSGASQGQDGRWTFQTREGQVWRQIDDRVLLPRPKPGSKLEIRRGVLRSYLANVDGQIAIRIRRQE